MQLPNNIPVPSGRNNYNAPRFPLPRIPSIDPPSSLPGFYITSETEIREGDVPMDGSISFFPYKDLSHIAIRQWDGRGNLDGATYVLQSKQLPPPPPPSAAPAPEQTPKAVETPQDDALVKTLENVFGNLNAGLADTFSRFSSTMQNMENQIDRIGNMMTKMQDDLDRDRGGIG